MIAFKFILTVFMAILIPIYYVEYGLSNFLWLSDITLILAYLALMFESRLLISMAAVGGIVFEMFWILSYILDFIHLPLIGLTNYMFDPMYPLWLRALSLFHLFLPPILIFLLARLGYTRKALPLQLIVVNLAFIASYFFTDPKDNINMVFSYPFPFIIIECVVNSLVILGTHFAIIKIMPKSKVSGELC